MRREVQEARRAAGAQGAATGRHKSLPHHSFVAGDFNCDADQPDTFPEAAESLQFSEATAFFTDATRGLGATESASVAKRPSSLRTF